MRIGNSQPPAFFRAPSKARTQRSGPPVLPVLSTETAGDFVLHGKIADKINSQVWSVSRPHEPGKFLALKVYHAIAGKNLGRIYPDDEIKLCTLRHANVVNVHGGGWCLINGQRRPYVLMDKHRGVNLAYLLPSVALTRAAFSTGLNWPRVFRQVMEGLQAIHQAGFVHLDVDGRNVMLDHNRHVTVMDLGLALPIGDPRLCATPLENSAPEISNAALGPVGPAADIYQLGKMIHEHAIARGFSGKVQRLAIEMMRRVPSERPTGAQVLQRLADQS